jgi:hypothetical protein
MGILQLEDKPIDQTIKECKGLFWRGSVNIFTDSSGRVKQTKEVRFLKRKSCTGYETCGWVVDHLREDSSCGCSNDILSNIEHGKLYTFGYDISTDWETGIEEIDEIYFVEVEEE